MASQFCGVCGQTVVRFAQDVCSICRAKGHVSLKTVRATPEQEKLMGALEPRVIVETALRQARTLQARLQVLLDGQGKPEAQVFRSDALTELTKIARILKTLTSEWRQLQKEARDAAEQMGQDERVEVLVEWFSQLPSNQQRDLIQRMTQVYNEGKVAG